MCDRVYWLLVSAALALSSGCVSASEVIPRQLSAETGCPANAISVNQLPGNHLNYRATGCGFSTSFVCTRQYSGDIGPCVNADPSGTVQKRMAADTGCAAAAVTVTELPGNAYRAVGCGQTATFVCTLSNYSGIQSPLSCIKEG
ncbi:MAG: hypothetical protein ACLPJH_05690 [Myxococcaceae bacterium]